MVIQWKFYARGRVIHTKFSEGSIWEYKIFRREHLVLNYLYGHAIPKIDDVRGKESRESFEESFVSLANRSVLEIMA